DFDYIHLSLPQYDAKPADSDQTYAELMRAILPQETKLIIVGNVMDGEAARDALKYTDLVAIGRASMIDPQIARKIVEGRDNEIVSEISPAQIKRSQLTPGLVNLFSDPKMEPHLPGRESIYSMHQAGSLSKSVLKNGTSSEYNLEDLK
ncbi:MAG TPA: NADH-dependent oxidoreductase, partial [Candidatus Ligilactobacillus excrementipullorum]|nr:NADH-dependent oxidoreductase [Candidatus Ligilactobacillus excrementipullorum]